MDKISVIIPIYNVEQYLSKCLDSVINQTYKNLEIICVNDCSPDNSSQILEQYAQKDNRIKVINRDKNGGLSATRNTGMDIAAGEYIYFIDSDDWIHSGFIEKMHETITKQAQKAVCCTNIINVYGNETSKPLLKRDFNEKLVPYSHSCQMAWSWLLRKDFLDKFKIIFPVGLKYEDLYFFHVIIRSLEKVFVINSTTYYHFENPDSIMGTAKNRTIDNYDIINILRLIYETYKSMNKISQWSIPFFYMPKYMLNIHTNKRDFFKQLKEFFNEIKEAVLNNKYLYSDLELKFFDEILNSISYDMYKNKESSIIGALRRNIIK